jgi:hypothetical protein
MYQLYNVTDLVRTGEENAIGAMLDEYPGGPVQTRIRGV